MKREYEEGHTGWFVNTETGIAHLLHIGWFGGDRLNEWYLKCGGPICPAGGDRIGRKCHGPREPWVDRRDVEPREVCERCRRKEGRRQGEVGFVLGSEREALEGFLQCLKEADLKDDQVFRDVLERGMLLLHWSNLDCAVEFDVSRPTVRRWRAGRTSPGYAVRRVVQAEMSAAIERTLEEEEGPGELQEKLDELEKRIRQIQRSWTADDFDEHDFECYLLPLLRELVKRAEG